MQARAEVEEPLEVVTGGHQGPFKAGLFLAAQQEANGLLDDAEHGFHGLLAQPVELFAFRSVQAVGHAFGDGGVFGQWRRVGPHFELGDAAAVILAGHGGVDDGCVVAGLRGEDGGLAEVSLSRGPSLGGWGALPCGFLPVLCSLVWRAASFS